MANQSVDIDPPEVLAVVKRLVENNRKARVEQDEAFARLTHAFLTGQPLFEALTNEAATETETTETPENSPEAE